jgi:hypothetical protein
MSDEDMTDVLKLTDKWVKTDAQAFADGLNGFEELAIERFFKRGIDELPATIVVRALMFIRLRRDGVKDPLAYRASMTVLLSRLRELFTNDRTDEGDEGGKDSDPA